MKVGVDDYIRNEGAEAADLGGLPRVELWPTLAREALHGPAGRIVEALDPFSEADPVTTLVHVLTAVGNMIGPAPHARVQHDEHPGRLFAVLVGRTSKARKGTGWSGPRHLLAQVDEAWARHRVRSGLSTGEGLIHHVRDAREEQEPIKEKGRVVGYQSVIVDEGEADKRLLAIEPEFAVVLKRMERQANELSGVLRQAWDSGVLSTLTRGCPLRATGAHVSILGHCTEEEVRRYLTATERANGFANRFLWLLVQRSKVLPEGGALPEAEEAHLVNALSEVVRFGRAAGEVRRDAEARAIWAEVYPRLSEGEHGMVGAILSRAEAQVLRLSVLYAILDRSELIRPEHLYAALALWDYAEASARRIFGGRLGSSVADTILEALKARGPLTRKEMHNLFGRHRTKAEVDAALAFLEGRGWARPRPAEPTGGRPSEAWEAVGDRAK